MIQTWCLFAPRRSLALDSLLPYTAALVCDVEPKPCRSSFHTICRLSVTTFTGPLAFAWRPPLHSIHAPFVMLMYTDSGKTNIAKNVQCWHLNIDDTKKFTSWKTAEEAARALSNTRDFLKS